MTSRMRNRSEAQSSIGSGGRCTRSQVAPDWTLTESLILVNEIAAVEADCQKALSSFQKWKIISENCNALEVPRNFNHCRRKWDSLLLDYNKITKWESRSGTRSYWSLNEEKAKQLGLPQNFDNELFKAIENLVKLREERCDTDPESDPEDEADVPDAFTETGSKRRRRKAKSHRDSTVKLEEQILEEPLSILAEKKLSEGATEKFRKSNLGKRRQESHSEKKCFEVEEKPQVKCEIENTHEGSLEEVPLKCLLEAKLHKDSAQKRPPKLDEEEEVFSNEEMEKAMTVKLQDTAEKIQTIVFETAEHKADDELEDLRDWQTEFIRHQGDKLISCLGEIVHTLDQLCTVVHERK